MQDFIDQSRQNHRGTLRTCMLVVTLISASACMAQDSEQTTRYRLSVAQSESFVENKGQWDPQAMYLATSRGVDTWITETGVVYDFHKSSPDERNTSEHKPWATNEPPPLRTVGQVVRASFVGARPTAASGQKELEGKFNYFFGTDKRRWASGVRRFSEVRTEQIYRGISIRHYFDQGAPRYDLIAAPDSDPSKIQMRFEGANGLAVQPDGSLRLETCVGPVEERGLRVYQKSGPEATVVPAAMELDGDVVRFRLGKYDKSKPLVIDPLIYCTYLGGNDMDDPTAVRLSGSGNAVIAGLTASTNFPTTAGAYQRSHDLHNDAAFVSELSPDGSTLVFSTYLGAGSVNALALNEEGCPVLTGVAGTGFPTTAGALQVTPSGQDDAFVCKLSPDGSHLLYSSLLGGSGFESGLSLVLDAFGNAVVVGATSSMDFPTTRGAYERVYDGGYYDAFVTKLSADGSHLIYSTFLGGSSDEWVSAVALDASGCPIVTGGTDSLDFPTTAGVFQPTSKTNRDAFFAKLSSNGSRLLFSTYLGGSAEDQAVALAVDGTGDAVIAGTTTSVDFPVTPGAFQMKYPGTGNRTGFIVKMSPDGKRQIFGTYLGGSAYDEPCALAVDRLDNPVVAGATASVNFPTTPGAFQTLPDGPTDFHFSDAFIVRLDTLGSRLIYGTLLGGNKAQLEDPNFHPGQLASGLALVNQSTAIVVGLTNSPIFPCTRSAFQTNFGGIYDGFVTSLPFDSPLGIDKVTTSAYSVEGGGILTGSVHLDGTSNAVGVNVALLSSSPNLYVPPNVKVGPGQFDATFQIVTRRVTALRTVTIAASYGGATVHTAVTIEPFLRAVRIFPSNIFGGAGALVTVTLWVPAGLGGISLNLRSSNPHVTLPDSVSVPPGGVAAYFAITTEQVDDLEEARISATYGAENVSATLILEPMIERVWLSPAVVAGGKSVLCTAKLATYGHYGEPLVVASDSPVLQAPATVEIPSFVKSVSFEVQTLGVDSAVVGHVSVTFRSATVTATVTVNPGELEILSLHSKNLMGGRKDTCSVALSGFAGPSGVPVTLTSDSPLVTVPTGLVVKPNHKGEVFPISTKPVTTPTDVTITASAKGRTAKAVLHLIPGP